MSNNSEVINPLIYGNINKELHKNTVSHFMNNCYKIHHNHFKTIRHPFVVLTATFNVTLVELLVDTVTFMKVILQILVAKELRGS